MNDLDSTTPGYEELASPTANGGEGWQPIRSRGTPSSGSDPRVADIVQYGLKGTFDGQGYEIRDLCINRPGQCYVGLFGSVDGGGIIKNVGVVNVAVTGSNHVGVLAGRNTGTVSNSYSIGNVTGKDYVGGLVGRNSDFGNVSNSHYNYDEVLINGENIITVGALSDEDFKEWLANDKFLDINDRLSQENGYYVVNNVADFKELLAFGQDNSLKFRLKNDLDLAAEPNLYIPYFAGEFDGNGHKISNLSFDFDFVSPVGLFGCLASGEKVTDLGVENVNVTGAGVVGGLAGFNLDCTVSNSYSTGSVCGNSGIELFEGVGGLVGKNFGAVSNSYFSGNVNGEYSVGGLVAVNGGDVSNSYSTGSVTGDTWVGGLVGINLAATVGNSCSTASVTGDRHVGGLVGSSGDFSAVSNSYSTGSVTGDGDVGGLVGTNNGNVSNSYSTGSVIGDGDVGGLMGYNSGTVRNSYSTGRVTGNDNVGGLVGRKYRSNIRNSFWDTQTSGQATSAGGTEKTTAQMKSIATFSGATWDIIAVADSETRNSFYMWNIVDDETYPFLSWQPVS